jgi:hydrogenase maturation protease
VTPGDHHRHQASVSVIGLGNPRMGDDGVGVVIAGILEEQRLSGAWESDAEIVAAGEDPTIVAAALSAGGRVLVVDAVDMGREPGACRLLSRDEVLGCAESSRASTHSLPLASVVQLARALGCEEGLRILGIHAGSMSPGSGLSPGVRACLPLVVQQVRREAEVLS